MDHELEACVESTKKCLLVHANEENTSPVSISFFKIMFGKQFSEFMVLPPKVVSSLLLTVQETFLEDSRGLKWDVSIALIDGLLAFQQGWNAFSMDHNLKVGYFLVFNYIKGSHFTVKIYDYSGCEVTFSEIQHLKKRKGENRDFSVNDEDKPGENRAIDLDLSSYEKLKKIKVSGSCDASNKVAAKTEACFHHPDSSLRLRTASALDKIPVTEEVVTSVIPSDTSEIERTKKRGKNVKKASDSEKDISRRLRNGPASVKIPVAKEEVTSAISSKTSEIERTLKKDDKVKTASASAKGSFTRMSSGHLLPTRPVNPEQNGKTVSDIPNDATKKRHTADESGNDQVAVSRKEHNLVDGSFQSPNNKLPEVSKPYEQTKGNSKTQSLNSKRNIITAAPSGAPDLESTKKNDYSEAEVIKLGSASGDVSKTPTLKCVETEESEAIYPDISKTPTKLSQTADRSVKIPVAKEEVTSAISSKTSEIERTLKKDDKVKTASASAKGSFTRMSSGHLLPTRPVNPEQNGKNVSDIPNDATKKRHTADESGNDQVAVSRKEHNLVDGSFQSPNNKLPEVSKPYEQTKGNSKTHSLNSKRNIITAAPSGAPDLESTKKNDYSEAKVIKLGSASDDVSKTPTLKCVETEESEAIYPDISKTPTKLSQTADRSGESLKSSHKLKVQTKFPSENKSILQVVKPEPVDADLVSNNPSVVISCLVATTAFLGLPKRLPLPLNSSKKRSTKQDKRIVHLQGSDNRSWPVLYVQNYLFRALTSGWTTFCMANNIEQGHQITVEVTDPVGGTCCVQVIARDDMAIFDR